MKSLEEIYMENQFYSSGNFAHESNELKQAHHMLAHSDSIRTLVNNLNIERKKKSEILHEVLILRSYIEDLINLHQQKREV